MPPSDYPATAAPSAPRRPSILERWWQEIDHSLLTGTGALMAIGVLAVFAASPAVADRIGASSSHFFVVRHLQLLPIAAMLLLGSSLLSEIGVRRLGLLLFAVTAIGLVLTLLIGVEIKGARRWISLGGGGLQISEFAKPALAIAGGWLLMCRRHKAFWTRAVRALPIYITLIALIILQPDLGTSVVLTGIFGVMLYIGGLPYRWVSVGAILTILALVAAYITFPHVEDRIDRFLNPEDHDTYQLEQSLRAFQHGSWFGVGPGEGRVKRVLPDAHADFIFPVIGEEFGIVVCIGLLMMYMILLGRAGHHLQQARSPWIAVAGMGLITQLSLQVVINVGSSIGMLPTKGMTLPFLSFGGSSLLASSLSMGLLIALTRAARYPRPKIMPYDF